MLPMGESLMMRRILLAASFAALGLIGVPGGSGCTGAQQKPDPGPLPAIELENAYPNLTFDLPLFLCHDGADAEQVYVVEQDGRIWRFQNDAAAEEKDLFLNIVDRMPTRRKRDNEEGLLALTFHPKFKDNGYFFVTYSMHEGGGKKRRGVLSRFKWDRTKDVVDMASEKIFLEVDQPYGNHKGCMLVFGSDGFLYATFGDGGSAGDPHGAGQNLGTLLAKCLRIDVDKEEGGKPYAIPQDNPFVGKEGALPEIWAYGLRNLWRMSFDRETGTLWGGDVGQNALEEIDIIVKGGNYGWNKREGTQPFRKGGKTDDMVDPVAEYGRDMGLSVTGGYVYRGKLQEKLKGIYVYADYGTGRIWGLDYDYKESKVKSIELLGHFPRATISSFGEDADGELYACGHRVGTIYRVKAIKE
jgi:hypothetical protein